MDFLSKNIPTVARVKKQIRCKKIAIKKLKKELIEATWLAEIHNLDESRSGRLEAKNRLKKEKSRLQESRYVLEKLKANRWRPTTIFEAEQIGLDLRRTFCGLFEVFGQPTTDVFISTPHRGHILNRASLDTIEFKIVSADGSPTVILSHYEPEICPRALKRSKETQIAFIFDQDGISTIEENGYQTSLFFRPDENDRNTVATRKVWNLPGEMSPEVFENLVEMFRRIIVAVSYRNSPGFTLDFDEDE